MTRFLTLLLTIALVTGCSAAPQDHPPDRENVAQSNKAAGTEQARSEPAGPDETLAVPPEDEVCQTPPSDSEIQFILANPQSDASFRTFPGWTVPRPNYQILGAVVFPAPVDPASVRLTLESTGAWEQVEQKAIGAPESYFPFAFFPTTVKDGDPALQPFAFGEAGWLTLTLLAARDKEGNPLVSEPLTLRIFAYDRSMAQEHPYLSSCLKEIPPGPGGH